MLCVAVVLVENSPTILAGDFNLASTRQDRYCKATAAWTGSYDHKEQQHFDDTLGIPHHLQELPQHGQVLGGDLLEGLEGLLHLVVWWVF